MKGLGTLLDQNKSVSSSTISELFALVWAKVSAAAPSTLTASSQNAVSINAASPSRSELEDDCKVELEDSVQVSPLLFTVGH